MSVSSDARVTYPAAKRWAKSLQHAIARHVSPDVPLAQAQLVLAEAFGFKDWHALHAGLSTQADGGPAATVTVMPHEIPVRERQEVVPPIMLGTSAGSGEAFYLPIDQFDRSIAVIGSKPEALATFAAVIERAMYLAGRPVFEIVCDSSGATRRPWVQPGAAHVVSFRSGDDAAAVALDETVRAGFNSDTFTSVQLQRYDAAASVGSAVRVIEAAAFAARVPAVLTLDETAACSSQCVDILRYGRKARLNTIALLAPPGPFGTSCERQIIADAGTSVLFQQADGAARTALSNAYDVSEDDLASLPEGDAFVCVDGNAAARVHLAAYP